MFRSDSTGTKINVYQSVYGNEWTTDETSVLETTSNT